MSQEQLGRHLGVGTRSIRRWEHADELPEAAVPIVEKFLASAEVPPMEKTLKNATLLELVTEVLIRVSAGNEVPPQIDGRQEFPLPSDDPDEGSLP